MKPGYFLYLELISNQKFGKSEITEIKASIENNDDFFLFSESLSEGLELNFNSHIEIYVEDQAFDSDITNEVEKFIQKIEDLVPGGWSKDSKVEWLSSSTGLSNVWYKDEEKWKSVIRETERDFTDDEDWEDFGSGGGFYTDYEDY